MSVKTYDVRTRNSVKKSRSIRAISISIGTGDLGRGGPNVRDIIVDLLDSGHIVGVDEPGSVVVGLVTSSSVSSRSHGDGISDRSLQRSGLSRGAARVSDISLLDAGTGGDLALPS